MIKHAIVTGSSKGIGRELALLLIENGFKVYGYSRSNSINHINFKFQKTDLSDVNALDSIKLPEINKDDQVFLINNAGEIGVIDKIGNKRSSEIINEFNINLIAPTILCNNIINFYKGNSKIVINISSGAALRPIESWGTYCQSKSAIDMLTKMIEAENNNVKAYSVYPGVVDTEMQLKIRNTETKKFPLRGKFIEYYNNNELVDPKVIAKKIAYLMNNSSKFDSNMISLRDLVI